MHTHKHPTLCTHTHTHRGTRLERQLVLAPTNSEEFVVIATVKWDDFTVSHNVSWPPWCYGNITRRRQRRLRRKKKKKKEHQRHLCIPQDWHWGQRRSDALTVLWGNWTHSGHYRDQGTGKLLSNTFTSLWLSLQYGQQHELIPTGAFWVCYAHGQRCCSSDRHGVSKGVSVIKRRGVSLPRA